jgi:hypothetical protein
VQEKIHELEAKMNERMIELERDVVWERQSAKVEGLRMRGYNDPHCAAASNGILNASVRAMHREMDNLKAEMTALKALARKQAAAVHEHDLSVDATVDFGHVLCSFLDLKWHEDEPKYRMKTWDGQVIRMMLERIKVAGPTGARFDKSMIMMAVNICNRYVHTAHACARTQTFTTIAHLFC